MAARNRHVGYASQHRQQRWLDAPLNIDDQMINSPVPIRVVAQPKGVPMLRIGRHAMK